MFFQASDPNAPFDPNAPLQPPYEPFRPTDIAFSDLPFSPEEDMYAQKQEQSLSTIGTSISSSEATVASAPALDSSEVKQMPLASAPALDSSEVKQMPLASAPALDSSEVKQMPVASAPTLSPSEIAEVQQAKKEQERKDREQKLQAQKVEEAKLILGSIIRHLNHIYAEKVADLYKSDWRVDPQSDIKYLERLLEKEPEEFLKLFQEKKYYRGHYASISQHAEIFDKVLIAAAYTLLATSADHVEEELGLTGSEAYSFRVKKIDAEKIEPRISVLLSVLIFAGGLGLLGLAAVGAPVSLGLALGLGIPAALVGLFFTVVLAPSINSPTVHIRRDSFVKKLHEKTGPESSETAETNQAPETQQAAENTDTQSSSNTAQLLEQMRSLRRLCLFGPSSTSPAVANAPEASCPPAAAAT